MKQSSKAVVREVKKVIIGGSPTHGTQGRGLGQGQKPGPGPETTTAHSLDIVQRYLGKGADKDNHSNLAITNVIIDAIEPAISPPQSPLHNTTHNTPHSTNNALTLLNTDATFGSTSPVLKNLPAYTPPRACAHRYTHYPPYTPHPHSDTPHLRALKHFTSLMHLPPSDICHTCAHECTTHPVICAT